MLPLDSELWQEFYTYMGPTVLIESLKVLSEANPEGDSRLIFNSFINLEDSLLSLGSQPVPCAVFVVPHLVNFGKKVKSNFRLLSRTLGLVGQISTFINHSSLIDARPQAIDWNSEENLPHKESYHKNLESSKELCQNWIELLFAKGEDCQLFEVSTFDMLVSIAVLSGFDHFVFPYFLFALHDQKAIPLECKECDNFVHFNFMASVESPLGDRPKTIAVMRVLSEWGIQKPVFSQLDCRSELTAYGRLHNALSNAENLESLISSPMLLRKLERKSELFLALSLLAFRLQDFYTANFFLKGIELDFRRLTVCPECRNCVGMSSFDTSPYVT